MSEYTREEILKLIEENGGPEGLDLSGKDLSGINLSREKITEELEKAREKAPDKIPVWYSERTEGINLEGANLEGASLMYAQLKRANLQGVNLRHAQLQGAILLGADLQGASLWDTCFRGADLGGANLRETTLAGTHLQGARLCYTHLEKADLFGPGRNLEGAYFYGVFLDDTRMRRDQLGEEIGEEKAKRYGTAREAYLALKNNFAEIGRYDDAAWAYCKERRMEKLAVLQKAKNAWQKHDWKSAIPRYAKVAIDQLVECVCDYGEGFWHVVRSLIVVWLAFTFIYVLVAGVWGPWQDTGSGKIRFITRNPIDLFWFSLGTMVTLHPPGLEARSTLLMRFLVPSQALLGIFLAGLLGFVAGNRIRRR